MPDYVKPKSETPPCDISDNQLWVCHLTLGWQKRSFLDISLSEPHAADLAITGIETAMFKLPSDQEQPSLLDYVHYAAFALVQQQMKFSLVTEAPNLPPDHPPLSATQRVAALAVSMPISALEAEGHALPIKITGGRLYSLREAAQFRLGALNPALQANYRRGMLHTALKDFYAPPEASKSAAAAA
jgi:hypothetical protein